MRRRDSTRGFTALDLNPIALTAEGDLAVLDASVTLIS